MNHTVDAPTPVLAVTVRAGAAERGAVVEQSVAALRETSRRLGCPVVGVPLLVAHDEPGVVEVCLAVAALPDDDPPPPIAAEVLVPGTVVTSLDEA